MSPRSDRGCTGLVRRLRTGVAAGLLATLAACGVSGPVIEPPNARDLEDGSRLRTTLLERDIANAAAIHFESRDERVLIAGFVGSEEERQGVLDVAAELFPGRVVVDRLGVR